MADNWHRPQGSPHTYATLHRTGCRPPQICHQCLELIQRRSNGSLADDGLQQFPEFTTKSARPVGHKDTEMAGQSREILDQKRALERSRPVRDEEAMSEPHVVQFLQLCSPYPELPHPSIRPAFLVAGRRASSCVLSMGASSRSSLQSASQHLVSSSVTVGFANSIAIGDNPVVLWISGARITNLAVLGRNLLRHFGHGFVSPRYRCRSQLVSH